MGRLKTIGRPPGLGPHSGIETHWTHLATSGSGASFIAKMNSVVAALRAREAAWRRMDRTALADLSGGRADLLESALRRYAPSGLDYAKYALAIKVALDEIKQCGGACGEFFSRFFTFSRGAVDCDFRGLKESALLGGGWLTGADLAYDDDDRDYDEDDFGCGGGWRAS